jgi:hypothetical protein
MNVTLAQYVSDKEPDEADFLAQSNQQGSGDKGLRTGGQLRFAVDF